MHVWRQAHSTTCSLLHVLVQVKLFGNDGSMTPLLTQQQYFAIVEVSEWRS